MYLMEVKGQLDPPPQACVWWRLETHRCKNMLQTIVRAGRGGSGAGKHLPAPALTTSCPRRSWEGRGGEMDAVPVATVPEGTSLMVGELRLQRDWLVWPRATGSEVNTPPLTG